MVDFTHIDDQGRVRMVDVTAKPATERVAKAQARIAMRPDTFSKIHQHALPKGNVLETARIAGIMAAKQTSALIPMCHPLNLTHVQIDFFPEQDSRTIRIEALAKIAAPTGVEMEALTAAAVAALTIYDMCKAHDREMIISDILLLEKSGGQSGRWERKAI
ncbi:MAG: cyclic pyranopterin monophosphate synthase MoaC [Desulfobacteraceae bacterium]|nr:cyclic pyranopterin monophosphate synthase MoaC [Desulfobacteraceae bacterium]